MQCAGGPLLIHTYQHQVINNVAFVITFTKTIQYLHLKISLTQSSGQMRGHMRHKRYSSMRI